MKKLYYNGKIVTMDEQGSICEALGIEDKRIVFLGSMKDAASYEWTEQEDLKGKLVLPAFTDTHMHVMHFALLKANLSLYGVDSLEKIIELGQERAARKEGYVFGMGWNQEAFQEPIFPVKEDMDRISTEVPVILLRACGHLGVVNTKALKLIETLRMPEDVRENIDFETGHLKESAMRLYMELMPKRDKGNIKELFLMAQRELNRYGITGVHSDDLSSVPGAGWQDIVEAMTELDQEGCMTVRVREQCLVFGDAGEFGDFCCKTKVLREHPGEFFEIGPRKLLQDGSLGAKSACMVHGYVGEPDNHGLPTYTKEELYQWIKAADDWDMDAAVHAIGDLAVKQVLDAFEKVIGQSRRRQHRHGIVHAQFMEKEDMARMAGLGVQAYIQPIFLNSDLDILDERIALEDQQEGYTWKSLQDAGVLISGGSDCPVEFFDPLKNIYAAVARKSLKGGKRFCAREALSVEEAVRLFTVSAAKAGYHETDRGRLKKGYLADFVVLDRDIFTVDTEEIKEASVKKTVVGGREVYEANG